MTAIVSRDEYDRMRRIAEFEHSKRLAALRAIEDALDLLDRGYTASAQVVLRGVHSGRCQTCDGAGIIDTSHSGDWSDSEDCPDCSSGDPR